jgi:hypothetical protein
MHLNLLLEEKLMKRTKLLAVVALALVICLPGMAGAVTTVGDGVIIGSWAQTFNESGLPGVGIFTKLETFMLTSGIDFEAPGFNGFSSAGWTTSMPNSDYVVAVKPAGDTNLNWNILFTSAQSTPLAFDFLAWNGTTVLERAHAVWNGGGWAFTPLSAASGDYNRVPVPPSVLLMGTGILGLAGLAWRRRKES